MSGERRSKEAPPVNGSFVVQKWVGDGLVFEPITMVREAPIHWKDVNLDLGELARLRWEEDWTCKELTAHFGFGRSKINKELRKLQKSH